MKGFILCDFSIVKNVTRNPHSFVKYFCVKVSIKSKKLPLQRRQTDLQVVLTLCLIRELSYRSILVFIRKFTTRHFYIKNNVLKAST